MNTPTRLATVVAMLLLASGAAWARSSDRNQPMDIDGGAAEYSVDDSSPTVISGGVVITQGTLRIEAGRAEITMRNGDPVRAVLTGSPVKLSQQLDDGTPMSATGSKVDYDLKSEVVVFTGNVSVRQPRGSLSGERVTYNMRTGQVNSGSTAPGGGRVKMRILPRTGSGSP